MSAHRNYKKDLVSSVIWIAVFLTILLLAINLNERVRTYPVSISVVGLVFSVSFLLSTLIRCLKGKKAAAKQTDTAAGETEAANAVQPEKAGKKLDWEFIKRKILPWVLIVGFAFAFKYLGFILSCFIFMFLFSHLMSVEPNLTVELLVALGFTAVMYVTFVLILGIKLPSLGILWIL